MLSVTRTICATDVPKSQQLRQLEHLELSKAHKRYIRAQQKQDDDDEEDAFEQWMQAKQRNGSSKHGVALCRAWNEPNVCSLYNVARVWDLRRQQLEAQLKDTQTELGAARKRSKQKRRFDAEQKARVDGECGLGVVFLANAKKSAQSTFGLAVRSDAMAVQQHGDLCEFLDKTLAKGLQGGGGGGPPTKQCRIEYTTAAWEGMVSPSDVKPFDARDALQQLEADGAVFALDL